MPLTCTFVHFPFDFNVVGFRAVHVAALSHSTQAHVLRVAPGKSSPEDTPEVTELLHSEHLGMPCLRRSD